MKFFLDTADIHRVKAWLPLGIVDGITTNPTRVSKLAKNNDDARRIVLDICACVYPRPVSIQVTEKDPEAVQDEAEAIAELAENVVVKIPCQLVYYPVIANLAHRGIPLNVTLVFSPLQALAMCKLGVKYLSLFLGRFQAHGGDCNELAHACTHMISEYNFSTRTIAASIRTVEHLNLALAANVDIATLPVEILSTILTHTLTDQGAEKFLLDWHDAGLTHFAHALHHDET